MEVQWQEAPGQGVRQVQPGPDVQQPPQLEQHLTELKDIKLADLTWELEEEQEQHQLLSDYEDKCAEEVLDLTEQEETLERKAGRWGWGRGQRVEWHGEWLIKETFQI